MKANLLSAILLAWGPATAGAVPDGEGLTEPSRADPSPAPERRPRERTERVGARTAADEGDRCQTQRVTLMSSGESKAARRHVCVGRDKAGGRTTESFVQVGEDGPVYKLIEAENGHYAMISQDGDIHTAVLEPDAADPEGPPIVRLIEELSLPETGGGGGMYANALTAAFRLTLHAARGQAGGQTDDEEGQDGDAQDEEDEIPEVLLSENEAAPPPAAIGGLMGFMAPVPTGVARLLGASAAGMQSDLPAPAPGPQHGTPQYPFSVVDNRWRIHWDLIGDEDSPAPFTWRRVNGQWIVQRDDGQTWGRLVNHQGYYLLQWGNPSSGYHFFYLPGTYPGHAGNLPASGQAVSLGGSLNHIVVRTFELPSGSLAMAPLAWTGTGANGLPTYLGTDGRVYQTYSQPPAYQCGPGGCWMAAAPDVIRAVPALPPSLAALPQNSNGTGFRLVGGQLYHFQNGQRGPTPLGSVLTLPGSLAPYANPSDPDDPNNVDPLQVVFIQPGNPHGIAPGYYSVPRGSHNAFHFLATPGGLNPYQVVTYHPVQGSNRAIPLIALAQGTPLNPSGHPRLFVNPLTGQVHYDQLTPYHNGYFARTYLAENQPQRAAWNGTAAQNGTAAPVTPGGTPPAGGHGGAPAPATQGGSPPATAQAQTPAPSSSEDARQQLLAAVQTVQQLGSGQQPGHQNYAALSLLLDVVRANEARAIPRPVLSALRQAYRNLTGGPATSYDLSDAYQDLIYAALRERDLEADLHNAQYDVAARHPDNPASITAANAAALLANVDDHREEFDALVERLLDDPPAGHAALLQSLSGFPNAVIVQGLVDRLGEGDSARASSLALLLQNYIAASWQRPHQNEMMAILMPLFEGLALTSSNAATRKWALRTLWSFRLLGHPQIPGEPLPAPLRRRIVAAALPLLQDEDADVRGEAVSVVCMFPPAAPVIAQLQTEATDSMDGFSASRRQGARRSYFLALAEMLRLHPSFSGRQDLIDWFGEQMASQNAEVREAAEYAWRHYQSLDS